ncbi:helix-turn-helix domain-containing protein [Pectinatus frisingensis]|uniref:helix-turn-helix domain-containing protein n=1 Tax=Pectinatus frisingensis TaxID=865 RepID=UPI0018C61527|nr:helix-turn-helix domain-containing protein [Pectinatus frisingensis]
MENNKMGNIIRILRQKANMTQKQLADKMNISDKTVSKWERGLGWPDISLIAQLSNILNVDTQKLLLGDITPNDIVAGNMKNTKYYICPSCNNISLCTGRATVSCCGKQLREQTVKKAPENEKLSVQFIEDDWHITSNHPMAKTHYISFVAFTAGGQINLLKQYPEWDLDVRIPKRGHGILIWYCTIHGLFYQLI